MGAQGASTRLARLALLIRSEQNRLFGADVSTPDGWDVILILYIADAEGRRLTVGGAIEKSRCRLEAGRRRIAHLSRAGIVIGDGDGDVDDVITLSPEAVTKVETLLEWVSGSVGSV